MEVNDELRQIIRDLGRALSEAISDSSDASRTLRRLREEGYSLFLLLGSTDDGESRQKLPLLVETKQPRGPAPVSAAPGFRINSQDLAFLNSIGIDPTRRPPRRRL